MPAAACTRSCKKTAVAAVAAVIVHVILEYVVHNVFLSATYHQPVYSALWNPLPAMLARMPAMLLAHVAFGTAFALIYTRGYETGRPALGQGLRYGFLVWLITSVPSSLVQYDVYPVAESLALSWIGYGLAENLILGAAVALIYRPTTEAAH